MNRLTYRFLTGFATLLLAMPLSAQDVPETAEELEPAVDTSEPVALPASKPVELPVRDPESGTLTTTTITGNAELPRVLYIVPWQKADPGDLLGKPVNSLLDELLQPIDRDEFRRQLRYYDDLYVKEAGGDPE